MYAYNLAMICGFLFAAVANQLLHPYAWGWRLSVGLIGLPAVGLVGLLLTLFESPQVLLQRGEEERAEQVGVWSSHPGCLHCMFS